MSPPCPFYYPDNKMPCEPWGFCFSCFYFLFDYFCNGASCWVKGGCSKRRYTPSRGSIAYVNRDYWDPTPDYSRNPGKLTLILEMSNLSLSSILCFSFKQAHDLNAHFTIYVTPLPLF